MISYRPTLREYFDQAIEKSKREINSMSDEYILGVDTDEITEYFVSKYELPTIDKDTSREMSWKRDKSTVREYERILPITIEYPIRLKNNLEIVIKKRASTFQMSEPNIDLHENSLRVSTDLPTNGTGQENRISSLIERLEKIITGKNNDVKNGNGRLSSEIRTYIEQKKETIKEEEELVEKIIKKVPIRLQKKTGNRIPVVDFKVKKTISPIMPEVRKKEELFLDVSQVDAVISYLVNACLSFETTPRVYSDLEEEDLRDILLGILNAIFEGDATGETFVKLGKTDIHLRIQKGSILVTECKFWDGEKKYHGAIDQLFSYLTWRQNYGIVITFSKRRNFSDVINNAKTAATNHKTYITDSLEVKNESYFITKHRFPDDPAKIIEICHLLFNLFYETP